MCAVPEKLNVLHCPYIVGGNSFHLAQAERTLGLNSRAVVLSRESFRYDADEYLCEADHGPLSREFSRWKMWWKAIRKYDVIHYNFGSGILPRMMFGLEYDSFNRRIKSFLNPGVHDLELRILKSLGKKIFVTYQGCDARMGGRQCGDYGIIRENFCRNCGILDRDKAVAITCFDKYASGIFFLNPDLGWNLPERAKFMPYAHVDPKEWTPCYDTGNVIPKVVHAPSNRNIKGTDSILAAVKKLHGEGVEFEFIIVENTSYEEAKRIYHQADILVDQLNMGWYGGLAVELMALGKPVICNIRDTDFKYLPSGMADELPIINASRDSIYMELKNLIADRNRQLKIGAESRAFVEKWHDPLKIAGNLKQCYTSAFK